MRHLLCEYFDGRLSRRGFLHRLVASGLTAAAARSMLQAADLGTQAESSARHSTSFTGTGGELLVEQIRAAGTRFVFSNPGSVEVGFFDALTDRPELQLIVGLHEGTVIGMADGYHKVSREPALVNVHAAVGTAQMAGQLYNAYRDGSSLVVTAGMSDNTVSSDDIGLAPAPGFTQAEINRQFTKISWEVRTPGSSALAIRRAYKVAATAPGGPVYVAFSRGALAGEPAKGDVWSKDAFLIQARPRPAVDQVEALANLLLEARRPVVVFGDEVWKAGAHEQAVTLCDELGLAAFAAFAGHHYFPVVHPQYVGPRYQDDRPYPFGSADLVVQCGTRDLGMGIIPDRPAVSPSARFAGVGLDTNMLGRTLPMDLAVVADVKETLTVVLDAVKARVTKERLGRIRSERLSLVKGPVSDARAKRLEQARQRFDESPIHVDRLGYELERGLDRNAIVVVENLAGNVGQHDFLRFGPRSDDKLGIGTVGGSLGWGIGAAIGAKLAAPDRQVVLSIGDGSVMYSAAGFWSMARYQVPVLVVVWNNHNYQTVRNAAYRYNRRMAATGHYHGLYLGDPDIDFVKLAESQGVRGRRVTSPSEIAPALARAGEETRAGNPYLVEVVVGRVGGGAESTWHQKFSAGRALSSAAWRE
ncbi:MAG: thiamine pyrophosphate-binding protein [Acidobacteria bacterium]|nr:thiamine pyrophosphate-binding protein [Acidobacteriota bacterium]